MEMKESEISNLKAKLRGYKKKIVDSENKRINLRLVLLDKEMIISDKERIISEVRAVCTASPAKTRRPAKAAPVTPGLSASFRSDTPQRTPLGTANRP
eukprot:812000-Prymnesium_polylepis.1